MIYAILKAEERIMSNIRWGIIGAGSISNETAEALKANGMHFEAIYNRTYDKAMDFAQRHGVEHVYETAEELFASDIDAVYITTLNNHHYRFIRQALLADKHVLCEKSITLNSQELEELNELAKERKLILAEAMTIYHMPLYEKIAEMIASGETGNIFLINVSFGSYNEYDAESRFFDMTKGAGALLDIGVYAIAMARYFLKEQPDQIVSLTRPSFTGSDEEFGIVMKNSQDEMATIIMSMHVKLPKRAVISCEKGYFEIIEYPRGDKATYTDGKTREVIEINAGDRSQALPYEFADMEKAIMNSDPSIMKTDLTRDVMEIMTKLRYQWGYIFPEEN